MLILVALFACTSGGQDTSSGISGAVRPPLASFPSADLVDSDGFLAIPQGLLPQAEGGLAFPVDRLTWRTGFSPVQTTVIDPEIALDPSSLPGPGDVASAGSVQLWDLTDGRRVPGFAELDAWCDAVPDDDACQNEVPALLVRPLQPVPLGHHLAVAVTTQVRTADGQSWAGPQWWQDLRAGRPGPDLQSVAAHYDDVVQQLADLGLDSLALVVDFPIGDGALGTRKLAQDVRTPTDWTWTSTASTDDGDTLPPYTWKQLKGTFQSDNWLVDDVEFDLVDGVPQAAGLAAVSLTVHMPESVRDAPAGTAPVWIFGHGIFSQPADYLGQADDPSGVLELADRAGAIVVATTWRGLTTDDLLTAVNVGNDLARIPELTDKLAQGLANTIALRRLVTDGGLLDDPLLEGKGDPTTVRYYGISLGGIEGAALLALDPDLPYGVLHVGGSSWSTMLERSSDWPVFEELVSYGVSSPLDRQRLYSATQLFWDEADPASFVDELSGRAALWQESIGDDQVPNLTTETLARGIGATLLKPSVTVVSGLDSVDPPTVGPALAQFDPQLGLPAENNRPAEVSGAHHAPRLWNGTMEQVLRFLDPDDPGVVEHFCGEQPCSADNPG
ncbi:MAG: hypothetical protein GXP62_13565 [Oligoflexia bacterium]|nr:hypothetical protein [Oligoflexia bacterium]